MVVGLLIGAVGATLSTDAEPKEAKADDPASRQNNELVDMNIPM